MKNIYEEEKERFFKSLKDKRRLPLIGRITEDLVNRLRREIALFEIESTEQITILIDTRGGDCEYGMFLCDFIQSIRSTVSGLVIGDCGSMGIAILQACDIRMAWPNSRFEIHPISGTFRFDVGETNLKTRLANKVEEVEEIYSQIIEFVARRVGKPVKFIYELYERGRNHDWKFGTKTALEHGFIDKIVTDTKLFSPSE